MNKRRAEDTLLCGVPSKRLLSYGRYGDANMPADPPSLLALLGGRCSRKRPHYSHSSFAEAGDDDEQEACFNRREHSDDPGDHRALNCGKMAESSAATTATTAAANRSRDLPTRTQSPTQRSTKKRPRQEAGEATTANDNINSDDIRYNSFQFWRVPLPAVDLSLLEPADSKTPESRRNPSGKNPALDAMET